MNIFEFMAYIAGLLVIISTLPQVIKTLKTKHVRGLSLSMFLILFTAQALWLVYGIYLKDMPLISTNGLSMIIVGTNIALILKYRNA